MIDARISVGLPAHPKTKKLIRRVGEGGAWRLVCLFLWVAANRSDGNLSGMTGEDIELAADWQGDEGSFVKALCEVGFLDGEDGAFSIHDWEEHNPWAAGSEARSEKARWLAACKHHGREKAAEIMPAYAARLLSKSAEHADSSLGSATSMQGDASSTQVADSSCAPSPSPYPSPVNPQSSFAIAQEDPPPATRSDDAKPATGRKQTFSRWAEGLKASGEKAISDYKPVWEYAKRVGIPADWVQIAWVKFSDRYRNDANHKRKTYIDWRKTFLNAVEANWFRLWAWSERDQSYVLTTVGRQADADTMEPA